jgi:hypothetical protein
VPMGEASQAQLVKSCSVASLDRRIDSTEPFR